MSDFLKHSNWMYAFGKNMPIYPDPSKNGFFINLSGDRILSYLVSNDNLSLNNSIQISGKIKLSNDCVLNYKTESINTCESPAKMRVMLLGGYSGKFNRWFSREGVLIKNGRFTLSLDLFPKNWVSVFGKNGADYEGKFKKIVNGRTQIGLVFGGGCFYGHGIECESGSLQIEISNIKFK